MKLTFPKFIQIAILYGIINMFANFCGIIIPSSFTSNGLQTEYMSEWLRFFNDNYQVKEFITIICNIIPLIFCTIYGLTSNKKKFESRFINLPMAYASIGITGWITNFLFGIGILWFARKSYNFQTFHILLSSLLHSVIECLFSFTISFFVAETLHRRIFLPRFFPEGHLQQYKGRRRPSLHILFYTFYIAVCAFPILYILSAFFSLVANSNYSMDKKFILILFLILICGIFLLINLIHYFTIPLSKLKKATKEITAGNYKQKVKIVSNDSFGDLADTFNDMIDSLNNKTERLIAVQNSILTGMAMMIESRDNSTGGHIKRTSDGVRIFINYLKTQKGFEYLSEEFCRYVIKAAPMHDLGKIAVSDAILQKPGKFTPEEYEIMKSHSAEGAKIVEYVLQETDNPAFQKIAINVAHYHHEKWNGSGYPAGLKETEIPLEARIMALADVFDALVSKRCYKDSFTYDKAFQIIDESSGTHFDPVLAAAFIQCRPQLENLYDSYRH